MHTISLRINFHDPLAKRCDLFSDSIGNFGFDILTERTSRLKSIGYDTYEPCDLLYCFVDTFYFLP